MASFDLGGTLTTLKSERVKLQQDLTKLEKAIAALEGIGPAASNGHTGRRPLSVAARARIAKAQKLRWAKVRQQQKAAKS